MPSTVVKKVTPAIVEVVSVGPQGAKGPQGDRGLKGDKGDKGDTSVPVVEEVTPDPVLLFENALT